MLITIQMVVMDFVASCVNISTPGCFNYILIAFPENRMRVCRLGGSKHRIYIQFAK